jgi:hypothetical protein
MEWDSGPSAQHSPTFSTRVVDHFTCRFENDTSAKFRPVGSSLAQWRTVNWCWAKLLVLEKSDHRAPDEATGVGLATAFR